jgi:hypothetical protein
VRLDLTPSTYGGKRVKFICPAQECERRVAANFGAEIDLAVRNQPLAQGDWTSDTRFFFESVNIHGCANRGREAASTRRAKINMNIFSNMRLTTKRLVLGFILLAGSGS